MRSDYLPGSDSTASDAAEKARRMLPMVWITSWMVDTSLDIGCIRGNGNDLLDSSLRRPGYAGKNLFGRTLDSPTPPCNFLFLPGRAFKRFQKKNGRDTRPRRRICSRSVFGEIFRSYRSVCVRFKHGHGLNGSGRKYLYSQFTNNASIVL